MGTCGGLMVGSEGSCWKNTVRNGDILRKRVGSTALRYLQQYVILNLHFLFRLAKKQYTGWP